MPYQVSKSRMQYLFMIYQQCSNQPNNWMLYKINVKTLMDDGWHHQNVLIVWNDCGAAGTREKIQSVATFPPTQQGHRTVWWKMHHLHPQCLLYRLSVRAVFWHDAFSFESWGTRNISTSLCQTPPASQDGALWLTRWQWQTDNDWMLHFTSLTFFFFFFFKNTSFFFSIVCWAGEKEDKGWLRKITFSPLRTFFTWRHIGQYDGHVAIGLQWASQGQMGPREAQCGG